MKVGPFILIVVTVSNSIGVAGLARADMFILPAGETSLQLVTVGDAGNAADGNGLGSVPYTYQIGKFDVTSAQYAQFLNAVATTSDPYDLYQSLMAPTVDASCGIIQSGNAGNYSYSVEAGHQNFPVDYVSWGSAARFCNWLTNGQPTGPEGPTTTEQGSYALNGAVSANALVTIQRSPKAIYAIPSENEWYKAAYYKGGSKNSGYWLYPTQSNSLPSNVLSATGTNNANFYGGTPSDYTDPVNFLTPVGAFADSPGPYGTFDQGGDVAQWNEFVVALSRDARAGFFNQVGNVLESNQSIIFDADEVEAEVGFRVVEVPEPGSATLLAAATLFLLHRPRRALSKLKTENSLPLH